MPKKRIWEVNLEGSKAGTKRVSSGELAKAIDRWVDQVESSSQDDGEKFVTIRSRVAEDGDK